MKGRTEEAKRRLNSLLGSDTSDYETVDRLEGYLREWVKRHPIRASLHQRGLVNSADIEDALRKRMGELDRIEARAPEIRKAEEALRAAEKAEQDYQKEVAPMLARRRYVRQELHQREAQERAIQEQREKKEQRRGPRL